MNPISIKTIYFNLGFQEESHKKSKLPESDSRIPHTPRNQKTTGVGFPRVSAFSGSPWVLLLLLLWIISLERCFVLVRSFPFVFNIFHQKK